MTNNLEIRQAIEHKRLKYWEVAKALNIDPATFSKWLRVEIEGDKKQMILDAIDKIQ